MPNLNFAELIQHAINNDPKALAPIFCFGPLSLNYYYITLPISKSYPKVLEDVVLPEITITYYTKD
jgi:hypothetical protein